MKSLRKIVAAVLVAMMATGLMAGMAFAEDTAFATKTKTYSEAITGSYTGKTVILHSNDSHGAIEGFAYIKSLKKAYEDLGAQVIMVDAGDYLQGNVYTAQTKGKAATELMVDAGYDIAILGNHEFDYGVDVLKERISELENGNVSVRNKNVSYKESGEPFLEKGSEVITTSDGTNQVKINFISVDTPELLVSSAPKMVQGLAVTGSNEMVAQIIAEKDSTADLNILIGHLGIDEISGPNKSTEIWKALNGEIDFLIDGHSHSAFTCGEDATQKIQQTGTGFNNIGVIVIDNATKKIEDNYLIPLKDKDGKYCWTADSANETLCKTIKADIDKALSEKIGTSLVDLNGDKGDYLTKVSGNRNTETNLGDLAADALKWYAEANEMIPESADKANVVAIVNGGSVRSWIYKGDVTVRDVINSFPFNNYLCVVTVKGETLLRVLESSTAYIPLIMCGGFPQISGMNINVDSEIKYDGGDPFPTSTYLRPKSVKRTTIKDINGKAFDPNATYYVVTNDFAATGGDTYYELLESGTCFNSGILISGVITSYVKDKLKGQIGLEYEKPQGRITLGKYVPETADANADVMLAYIIMSLAAAAAAGAGVASIRRKNSN